MTLAPTFEPEAPDAAAFRKSFEDRRARAALRGWSLTRTDPADGPVSFHLGRWGMTRFCATLAELDRALLDIGVPPATDVRRVEVKG